MHDITIEELSLNNWQPLSTLLYDGWVLRLQMVIPNGQIPFSLSSIPLSN